MNDYLSRLAERAVGRARWIRPVQPPGDATWVATVGLAPPEDPIARRPLPVPAETPRPRRAAPGPAPANQGAEPDSPPPPPPPRRPAREGGPAPGTAVVRASAGPAGVPVAAASAEVIASASHVAPFASEPVPAASDAVPAALEPGSAGSAVCTAPDAVPAASGPAPVRARATLETPPPGRSPSARQTTTRPSRPVAQGTVESHTALTMPEPAPPPPAGAAPRSAPPPPVQSSRPSPERPVGRRERAEPAPEPPAVRVIIGRVEIRAPLAPVEPVRARPPVHRTSRALTLDDYLRGRGGR